MDMPLHFQSKTYTCGPASGKMVFEYLGEIQSEEFLEEKFKTNLIDGTRLKDMQGYFDEKGYETFFHSVKTSRFKKNAFSLLERFVNNENPAIVSINRLVYDTIAPLEENVEFADEKKSMHLVVVKEFDEKNVWFNDPHELVGSTKISRNNFYKAFKQYFLVVNTKIIE